MAKVETEIKNSVAIATELYTKYKKNEEVKEKLQRIINLLEMALKKLSVDKENANSFKLIAQEIIIEELKIFTKKDKKLRKLEESIAKIIIIK